ncbi:MAG: dynamin family protein [Opitutales bacterium]|nr:dynamin family protein [Opitutales bacterium]
MTSAYKVAFVGLSNVGKSKLINALLGVNVAPSVNDTCTASIVEFSHGNEFRIVAERSGTLMPEERKYKCVEQLREELSEMCAHGDGYEHAHWKRICVYIPSANILSGGLILVDTPGFGAAGSLGEQDEKTVSDFLVKEVAQIFWVGCTVNGGVGRRELEFYHRFLRWRCDDLVLTNGDAWTEQTRKRFLERYASNFRKTLKVHFVNGKQGADARKENDFNALEESGIADLEKRIKKLKEEDGRFVGVLESLKLLGEMTRKFVGDMREGKDFFVPTLRAQFVEKYRTESLLAPWVEMMSE